MNSPANSMSTCTGLRGLINGLADVPTHLSWAAILFVLIGRGGGAWSLDRVFGIR